MLASLGVILGSYLLGALPQVYLLGRLRGTDLRSQGDLHQALWRRSRLLGLLGFLADFAKGAVAVLVARGLGFPVETVALAGVAVVVGQMWPVFLPSSGGKGNSTAAPMVALLAVGPFLVGVIAIAVGLGWRMVSRGRKGQSLLGPPPSHSFPLAVAIALGVMPLASWWMGQPTAITWAMLALFLAILARRLTAGLRADLRAAPHARSVIFNRLLYDRSSL